MMIPQVFKFEGYETIDIQFSVKLQVCKIYLKRKDEKPCNCYRCGATLLRKRGRYRLRLETLSVMGYRCFIFLWREKGECPCCKKARSEHIEFIARETPHLTQTYAWWIGKMCEIAAVSRVAAFVGQDNMTVRRIDMERMQLMLQHYKIPEVTRISVDEVYARKKPKDGETRDDKFFTVITDLKTHKVIWVGDSRRKEALDQFFKIIGKQACKKILVVAMDQHESYRAAVKAHCPNAMVVWDRFHLVQTFLEAMNEDRKYLHEHASKGSRDKYLTLGRFRFIFLKKASKRSDEETQHIEEAMTANDLLLKMELIKERFLTFFEAKDAIDGWLILAELGKWIRSIQAPELLKWWMNLTKEWQTVKNYFLCRVTSALSEGINNVIKSLKRRAFGFRNMGYFKLKILQACGYLNSKFIHTVRDLGGVWIPT